MLRTVTYSDIDPAAWSTLVRESKTGTWFQSPEAYAFLSTQTQLLDPFVIGVEDSGLQAVCVGYILKSRDITLPTKVHTVKAMVFLLVMYGCESWNIKKVEHRRIDAFELWC